MTNLTHVERSIMVPQGKNDHFNKCHCVNWIATCGKKKESCLFFYPIHKINSRIIDVQVTGKTIKLSEENVETYLIVRTSKDFLNRKQKGIKQPKILSSITLLKLKKTLLLIKRDQ